MTLEEMSDLYIRIAFHYESTIDRLVGKGLLDKDFVENHRKTFYDSLDEEKLRASQAIRACLKTFDKNVHPVDNKKKQAGVEERCINTQAISVGWNMI